MGTTGSIALIVLSIGLMCLGIFLIAQNIKGIQTANKYIKECQEIYNRTGNETFALLVNEWKNYRSTDFVMLSPNAFVIINLFNAIRFLIPLL